MARSGFYQTSVKNKLTLSFHSPKPVGKSSFDMAQSKFIKPE